MEISFGNEQQEAELAAKRERLLARLEKRHAATEAVSPVKKVTNELDDLIQKALVEVAEKKINPRTIESLEQLIPSSSGRLLKRIQDTLEAMRKCALHEEPVRKGFSFVRKSGPAAPKNAEKPSMKKDEPRLAPVVSNNAVEFFDKTGVTEMVAGVDGSSVSLKNLTGCSLRFAFSPSAVHMKDIDDCTIMFPVVDSSVLMYNVKNSRVFAVAQQIRVHDAVDVELHVAVSGAVILETCRRVHMAPYRLKRRANGETICKEDGGQWREPKDFDWLGKEKSPHWNILEEGKWVDEVL